MKRLVLYFVLTTVICFSGATLILAETSASVSVSASTTPVMESKAKEVLFQSLNNMRDRYKDTLERLSNIQARMVSRFEKTKDNMPKETVTIAQKSIDDTRAQMDQAQKSLDILTSKLSDIENASTTVKIRVKLQEMKKPTKEMELRMKNSLSSMRKILEKLQTFEKMKKATSTPTL